MAFGKLRVDEIETSTQTVNVDALVGIAADGNKGDITVSGTGTIWTIDDGAVDTAALGGDITAAGKALLDDADAAAQRTTLGAEAAGTAASAISTHEAAADPHPGYALESSLATVATSGAYSDLTGTPTLVANLDDLGDVDLTTTPPADGEALVYDSATGDWVPGEAGGTPGGTTGQIQWNSAGSFAGVGGSTVGATGDITLSLNGAASTPPLRLTGTWFSGGTSTTTKPQLLIEPSGTTSTAWRTSGTGLGINAPSEFAGNLVDLQVGGASQFSLNSEGSLTTANDFIHTHGATTAFRSGVGYFSTGRELRLSDNNPSSPDALLVRDAADTFAQRRSTNAQTYRLYNTYTDSNNYQRTSIKDDSTGLVIDQQYAGTGAARTNLLEVKNNGVTKLTLGAQGNGTFVYTNGLGGISVGSNGAIGINANNNSVVNIGQFGVSSAVNLNTSRTVLTSGVLIHTPVTVSNLPAAATVGAGARGFVSDSTVAASGNFGATVTGGGSNKVPVFSDGTNWLIG